MFPTRFDTCVAIGATALCLAVAYGTGAQALARQSASKDLPPPTGTTGVSAFQPAGRAHVEVGQGATNGNHGKQPSAEAGFDNKPPQGAKEGCHRAPGGVDASGGENISFSGKDAKTCTGKPGKPAKRGQW